MKMCKNIGTVCVIISAIFMMIGCQSGQSRTTGQATVSSAGTEPSQQAPPSDDLAVADKDAPKIVLTKGVHDFGDVGPSSSQKANYTFENAGTTALLVENIQSTCGCSRPTLIKDGKRYTVPLKEPVPFEPGQSGKVEVTYKAGSTKGVVSKNLYIITNDPATPRAQLAVKAKTVVNVEVIPEKVDLKFDQNNAGMPDLVVRSIDGVPFSIKSITVANHVIDIPFDPDAEAAEFTLTPQVDTQKLTQLGTGVIQILTTHPQVKGVLVRYTAKPLYEVSNPRFILQNVEPSKPVFKETLIRSNYGNVAVIESATSRNGYMEIEKQEQGDAHLRLMVKIMPPTQESTSRRYITDELTITLKDGHQLTIRCSGWFRLKPDPSDKSL